MATIGSINVNIFARTGEFTKGLRRARRSLNRFGRSIRRSVGQVGAFGGALAAVAAGGGLAILTKQAFETIDALAKTGDRLGVAVDELQALQMAGELTGVSVQTMNMALQRMTRRVAEAAMGTGEAQGALQELGLDAQRLAAQSPDQQMRAIADAMQGVASQGDRVRLAMKLFDSEGVALVNTLANGAAGLDAVKSEMDELGISLTRVDAAQIENANDAVTRMRASTGALFQQIALKLAPFIEYLSNLFVDLAKEGGGFGAAVEKGFSIAIKVIGFAADIVQALQLAFKGAQVAVVFFVRTWVQVVTFATRKVLSLVALLPDWLGGGAANVALDAIDTFIGALDTELNRLRGEFMDQLAEPPSSEKIARFFKDIEKQSRSAAEEAAMIPRAALNLPGGPMAPATPELGGAGSFRQVVRSRVNLGQMQSQRTRIEADPREISLLEQLVELLRNRVIPASAA